MRGVEYLEAEQTVAGMLVDLEGCQRGVPHRREGVLIHRGLASSRRCQQPAANRSYQAISAGDLSERAAVAHAHKSVAQLLLHFGWHQVLRFLDADDDAELARLEEAQRHLRQTLMSPNDFPAARMFLTHSMPPSLTRCHPH
jgi:hypothetical protein